MKKTLLILIISASILTSCDKDPDPVSTLVNVSYPVIQLNGDQIVSTVVATGAYVDPGAVGTDDITGATGPLSPVSNNVDLTTPGFYSVKYTMKNANGFITESTRLVLVTSVDASVDLSGTYFRVSNNQTVTVTKRGPGLYTTDNVGGVPGNPAFIFDVYMGQINDSELVVPNQPSGLGGDIYCDNTTLSITPADTMFSYIVRGSGFGTVVRQFSHQ